MSAAVSDLCRPLARRGTRPRRQRRTGCLLIAAGVGIRTGAGCGRAFRNRALLTPDLGLAVAAQRGPIQSMAPIST